MHRFRKAVADAASVLQIICILSMHPGVNGGEAAASDVYADDFLYDMQKDPWQLNNVVADPAYAAVKAELRERSAELDSARGRQPAPLSPTEKERLPMLSAVEKKSDQVYRWLLAYIDENKFSGNQRLPFGKCALPESWVSAEKRYEWPSTELVA